METKQKDNRYGFLTTFSLIFAGVVGVGIFFKGQTVMGLTHSAMLMLIAWILISVIAMGLAYAYIEISSSTVQSEKSEQGSLYKWTSLFLNKKFGAFVGLFYCFFYMPLNLIALAIISSRMLINIFVGVENQADSFISGAFASGGGDNWATGDTGGSVQALYILLVYVGAMMIVFFCIAVNAFGTKFSKITQTFGTVFKIFSLLAIIGIIFFGIFAAHTSPVQITDDKAPNYMAGWTTDDLAAYDKIYGSFVGDPSMTGFFLALPAIMFTFDAFVQTGTLQSDTKTKKTFSRALISAMSIITILYLFIILGSGLIKDATGYDIPGLIQTIIPGSGFKIFLLVLITISGVTAANSWFIFLGRTVSDLAEHHEILNPNNDLQEQHKATGAYTHSYRLVLTILSIYLISFLILDLGLFPYGVGVDVRGTAGNVEIMSNDLIVMLMYGVYGLIVFGGIRNRKHNRVKVDKSKAFMPVAIFSVSLLFLVIVLYFISVPINFTGDSGVSSDNSGFGTFYALPIDIILMIIVVGVWYAFDQYFHTPGKKDKIDVKIALMKKNMQDKFSFKKANQSDESNQNNDGEDTTKENFSKARVRYSINDYKSCALEVRAGSYKQIWKPQQW